MEKKKNNFFFHVIQASTVFLTASRAYGIYDREYHVIASDWIIINRRARPGLCNWKQKSISINFKKHINNKKYWLLTCKAANNVKPIEINTNIVAITLVDANIFLSWLNGPIKKHVLKRTN